MDCVPSSQMTEDERVVVVARGGMELTSLPLEMLETRCLSVAESSPTSVAWSSTKREQERASLSVEMVDMHRLADTFASIVTHVCNNATFCTLPSCSDPLAFFFCPTKQTTFSMSYYCRRLLEFNHCSKACVPLALIYLLRIQHNRRMSINDYNVHRLVCTAFVLAAKWHDDVSYTNMHYATVGGVASTNEMNILERHMLTLLDHRLFVTAERFAQIESYIVQLALSK